MHAYNFYVSLSKRFHFKVSSDLSYSDFKPLCVCQQEDELHDNPAAWLPYKKRKLLPSVKLNRESMHNGILVLLCLL